MLGSVVRDVFHVAASEPWVITFASERSRYATTASADDAFAARFFFAVSSLISEIDEFIRKHMIPEKLSYKLLTVVEELCINTAFLSGDKHNNVEMNFEYSQEKQNVRFVVEYDGELADPMQDTVSIPIKLLNNVSFDCTYSINNGKNHVEGSIE